MPSDYCIQRFKQLIPEEWDGLDVGCGPHIGKLANSGSDFSPVPTHFTKGKKFYRASIYNLPFKDNSFDYVCSSHVVEHLEHPVEAVKEMARVAKHLVIANIPRYTLDPKEVTGCVLFDSYYFSAYPEMIKKLKLQKYLDDGKIILNKKGATYFYGCEANHCQWFPNPKDCHELFKKTGCFKRIVAEVCPKNCGESNVLGYL